MFEFDLKNRQFNLRLGSTRHIFSNADAAVLFIEAREALKIQAATASEEELAAQFQAAMQELFNGR